MTAPKGYMDVTVRSRIKLSAQDVRAWRDGDVDHKIIVKTRIVDRISNSKNCFITLESDAKLFDPMAHTETEVKAD